MNNLKHIFILVLMICFSGCQDNFLDRNPVNIMSAEQVFGSPEAVEAYFVTLYADLPIEDFSYVNGKFGDFPGAGNQYTANWTWESITSTGYSGTNHNDVWADLYKAIRNVNTFLSEIQEVDIPDADKNAYTAEARFVRAYYYAALAKYFGGVPVIAEPQQYAGGSTEELNLPRNTEDEVWSFVKEDLDFAAANLPADSDYGRANKYVALALLSRTMLHAGSVAKFGTVALDGLVGIPAERADAYLQASYEASKTIMDDGQYALFNKYTGDKAKNFQMLFYELQDNPEAIFCKGYDYESTRRTHSQDLMALPWVLRAPQGYANRLTPTLQMAEMFEYTDGSPGTLNTGTPGAYVHYDSPQDLFKGKDPRFFGSVISTHSMFKETEVTGQRGVIMDGVEYAGNNYNQYFDIPGKQIVSAPTANSVQATGNSKFDAIIFWLKKWTDPYRDASLCGDWRSETDWLDMRYGEVLLNYAEAAYELDKPASEALGAINQIRERAGIAPLASIDREKIRHERHVELAWENRTFWDLKRWRTLTTAFNIWIAEGLYMFYDVDSQDYVFKRTPVGGGKTYEQKHYYDQIPAGERAKNPLLVNNPGW